VAESRRFAAATEPSSKPPSKSSTAHEPAHRSASPSAWHQLRRRLRVVGECLAGSPGVLTSWSGVEEPGLGGDRRDVPACATAAQPQRAGKPRTVPAPESAALHARQYEIHGPTARTARARVEWPGQRAAHGGRHTPDTTPSSSLCRSHQGPVRRFELPYLRSTAVPYAIASSRSARNQFATSSAPPSSSEMK
jgi:hypothetical protein